MSLRKETPYSAGADFVGGEFNRGRSYTNWRPKGTADWLLIYTVAGSGCITTTSGTLSTKPGDVILYAPGDLHDYKTNPATGRWHLLWIHFLPKPAWHSLLRWPVGTHGVKSLHLEKGEVRDGFVGAMQRMLQIFQRKLPNVTDFSGNALEEALLWAHVIATKGAWMRTDTRIRKAMNYLASNLRQPFRLDTLARHCGLSVSRLAHLFKSETGLSPQNYFEQERMRHASQLLRLTGFGVAEVGAEVGYEDAFYFSNRFHRYAGKSPTQYRGQAHSKRAKTL
jgi:AraC family transcriptional regulator of arabinose operon